MTAAVDRREQVAYPLHMDVPAAARQSRWLALARPFLGLPVLVFAVLLNVGAAPATWAAIAVRGHAPAWLAEFQLCVLRWQTRAAAYLLLVTGDRPATGSHPVHVEFAAAPSVARWKVFAWKLVTAFPHLLVLCALALAMLPLALLGAITVACTGRLPAPLHALGAGAIAYGARLAVYLQSFTDVFPPFSLCPRAGIARRSTAIACAAAGLVPAGLVLAAAIFIIGFSGTRVVVPLRYAEMRTGSFDQLATEAIVESGRMILHGVHDPADDSLALFRPTPPARYVAFEIDITNYRGAGEGVPLQAKAFRLEERDGTSRRAALVGLDGKPGPGEVPSGGRGRAIVVFEVTAARPARLVWDVVDYISVPRRGETIEWVLN